MPLVTPDFRKASSLREAVNKGIEVKLMDEEMNLLIPYSRTQFVFGPWPPAHRLWYARVEVNDVGRIIKVY